MAENPEVTKNPGTLDVILSVNEGISSHKRSPIKSTSSTSSSCRICHDNDLPETLVSPCLCTGSLALVHVPCLEKWLTTSKTRHCEICEFPFKTKNNYRPIREWLLSERGPGASGHFYSDFLCLFLLSPLCFVSVYLCTVQAVKYIQKCHWEGIGLALISISILSTYFMWAFVTVRFHLRCLRNWQQEHRTVQLHQSHIIHRTLPREDFNP
ncbi:E3 ubiquitin-protein ligase MARCHF3-like isoform X1 [Rhodnius prolixus]|uniref:E3 ubiquitin-protein ligase MARCHF3-like isoform X1 n=1 Tax=Rhodnius prolixus TaxID=13249 RepID=UPI003D18B676